MAQRRNHWIGVGLNVWSLGIEAAAVIGLRTLKIAAGDAEGRLMVSAKIDAGLALQSLALTGVSV